MKLSKNFITQMELKIIPHVIEAAKETLIAYAQSKYFDNYMIGCSCWSNLNNRIYENLLMDDYFTVIRKNNVIKISASNDDTLIDFYCHRVSQQTRIPTGGKSLKVSIQQQLFLSDEIQELIANGQKAIFTLGYDISGENGLGKITFDMLSAIDKKTYQATTIHAFEYDTEIASTIIMPQTEKIQQPVVTKEVLPNSQKKVKKK